MKRSLLLPLLAALLAGAPAAAQNCSNTSVGLVPLSDLLGGSYQGEPGGLWPGGTNERPPAHTQAGLAQAAEVVPRDAAGLPDPASGKIGFVSIGMSNTRNHWSAFMPISDADPARNPKVVLVQGAQGGQSAGVIADPNAPYWDFVEQRVLDAGLSPAQVQVAWLLEAHAHPTAPFPDHALALRDDLAAIVRNVRARFPNVRLCYLASRIYAGYATTTLNPEPYAYENAFAVRWLLEAQLDGDPGLAFDPAAGSPVAPWLSWGFYPWADGLSERSDGLVWTCQDFQSDGTHPSVLGSEKLATGLHTFLSSDPTSAPWYLAAGAPRTGLPFCFGDGSGLPCPCGNEGDPGRGCANSAVPAGARLFGSGTPFVTADDVQLVVEGLPAGAAVLLFQAQGRIGGGLGTPFGDGLRCAGGGVVRLGATLAPGGASWPLPGDPPLSVRGLVPPSGGARHYQAWYRDTASFCTPAGFNLSNGLTVRWLP